MSTCPIKPAASEPFVAKWVRAVLLTGVIVGGTVMAVGLGLAFAMHVERPDNDAVSIGAVMKGALQGEPVAMLYTGLAILILTPVARVAILALGWSLAGERRFAVTALIVLSLLCVSMWVGSG
jgi:uncharacterized membrane protein